MPSISPLFLPTLLLLTLSLSTLSFATAHHNHHQHHHRKNHSPQPQDLVRSACNHARYPTICFRTLSTYPATTPRDLAQASVHVALHRARKVSAFLHSQAGSTKRTRSALSDCVEQLSESVDELSQTLSELKHLRGETLTWQLSNAETWVSAALTNEDTCLDGFDEIDGKIKDDVRSKITNVARVTSNALYMINRLDESPGRG